jgi:hypothetical protein
MKKSSKHPRPGTQSTSKAALTTAIAAMPLTVGPGLQAQIKDASVPVPIESPRSIGPTLSLDTCCLKYAELYSKDRATYTIIGTDNQHTIYQNARNEYFYLDPATGDMRFLAPDTQVKLREGAVRSPSPVRQKTFKAIDMKHGGAVTIIGMDEAGHTVQRNSLGETFYLDPATGDMVFAQ